MADYGNDQFGFYDSGYNQQNYGQNQVYDGYNQHQQGFTSPGQYDQGFSQQSYSQSPTIMTPQYNYDASNTNNSGSYTNFEDEPPLLEGSIEFILLFDSSSIKKAFNQPSSICLHGLS